MPERSWELLGSEPVADHRIFQLRHDRYRLAPSGVEHDFIVMDTADWVNVVAIDVDGRLILVKQYRHGLQRLSLEPPGGMIDRGETPEAAARRELREETGYVSEKVRFLGRVAPNPALQNNWCHMFLAAECRLAAACEPDHLECIAVELRRPEELAELFRSEAICHAMSVIALGLAGFHALAVGSA